jgi:hypothetical protein
MLKLKRVLIAGTKCPRNDKNPFKDNVLLKKTSKVETRLLIAGTKCPRNDKNPFKDNVLLKKTSKVTTQFLKFD